MENQAVVTSGGYERYFEEDGKTYIHIINPRTGYPADGDLLSVTIVSRDGTLADGMSTALYIMGYEKSLSILAAAQGRIQCDPGNR
ncbi:MAG: FAD:protein FMN transferase [Ruminococcus sp.]